MPLEGTLSYLDIAHLLQVVGRSRKSGILEITCDERCARLVFQEGRLVRAETNQAHDELGALLVRAGVLEEPALERALELQAADPEGRRLGVILCDELGLPSEAIQRVLAHQFRQIVFDVFRWPGGSFRFEFGDPDEVLDRFNLNPSEFILEVGLRAGFLAQEGMARQDVDLDSPGLVLALRDPVILAACADRARREGFRVVVCEGPEGVVDVARDWPEASPSPRVVLEVAPEPTPEDLERLARLREVRAGACIVAVGRAATPADRARLLARGADAYVRIPAEADLAGPRGEAHIDVFLLQMKRAMAGAALDPGGEEARA